MDDLGIPDFLRIDEADRRAAWAGRKLTKVKFETKVTRNEDTQTRAFRREMEKKEVEKKRQRIAALREKYGN